MSLPKPNIYLSACKGFGRNLTQPSEVSVDLCEHLCGLCVLYVNVSRMSRRFPSEITKKLTEEKKVSEKPIRFRKPYRFEKQAFRALYFPSGSLPPLS